MGKIEDLPSPLRENYVHLMETSMMGKHQEHLRSEHGVEPGPTGKDRARQHAEAHGVFTPTPSTNSDASPENHQPEPTHDWDGRNAEGDREDFRSALCGLLNRFSMENRSNTPDFILRDFICDSLRAFDTAVQERETWYGRDARPSSPLSASRPGSAAGREVGE